MITVQTGKRYHGKSKLPAIIMAFILLSVFLSACSGDDRLYKEGVRAMEGGNYLSAISAFEGISHNPDAAAMLPACYYKQAEVYREEGDYESAYNYFSMAGDYEDASHQANAMLYVQGHAAFVNEDHETAKRFFEQLEGPQEDYGYPHFMTLADAYDYMQKQRKTLNMSFSFYIDSYPDEHFVEILDSIFPTASRTLNYLEEDKLFSISSVEYMPSDIVLQAIESGQHLFLSPDELAVANKAKTVVEEATAAAGTPYELELWLHNWICENVAYQYAEYFDPVTYREMSCVGALLDGKADVWGYSDTFYLLGRMAGLDVNVVSGNREGNKCYWNTITLDGKTYGDL